VTILAGLGHAHRIASAAEALVFLEGYPTRLRDEAYQATIEACRDVLTGAAFAHRRGMLLDEPAVAASRLNAA
jgi:hypothetical protein